MKKTKFDAIELTILTSLIDRKLEKLNENDNKIDEFYMDYKNILKSLRDKIKKMNK